MAIDVGAEAPRTVSADAPPTTSYPRFLGRRIQLRWKLLAAFAGAFTVVFVFLAIWIFQYTTATAMARLETQLEAAAVGGAMTLNAEDFRELITTVPAVPDPSNPTGLGYPDSPLYASIAQDLLDLYTTITDANPYTYFEDPADGRLYFAVSAGYLLDPQIGVTYRVPVDQIVGPATYGRMEQGLTTTTNEPAYTDDYGSWISTYSPILDEDGQSVGAIGVDYPLTYVTAVQADVQRQLYPVLGISYVVLLALVLVLSTSLTRPLKRLTAATERIAAGEYDLDVQAMVRTRFPDEMYTLAESVSTMAAKVGARERSLTREVQRLKVEIDAVKREEAVKEITESDFFSDLTSKAADMRRSFRANADLDGDGI
jgi:HAMP domain-containing protein